MVLQQEARWEMLILVLLNAILPVYNEVNGMDMLKLFFDETIIFLFKVRHWEQDRDVSRRQI